ncbi:hypothetical protein V9K92_00255 [Phyllobacterium sp. CCNWLW109]|uniref:hypothetical protein n=1 Tax=Phyllobacterium sp. CCNWLW109 TaxID=3127479 RepID=UPI003077BDAC
MFKKLIAGVVVLACISAFTGCVSSPTPDNMARNTMQTAPADLQLACASAATAKFGADHANALPVSSSAVEGGKYQIIIEAKGQRSTCLIDTTGTVLSLEKIST